MALNARVPMPSPHNEPVLEYRPGSPERAEVSTRLAEVSAERIEVPIVIGGREIRTGRTIPSLMPHLKDRVLAEVHLPEPSHVTEAIESALGAQAAWASLDWEDRAAIFLRAADLLAGPWRQRVNAACMADQSKSVYQAEIDAACELIDFWRFNVHFMEQIYSGQPIHSPGILNSSEYRPLEGFVFASTPFNFASIQANLATAPALMGNTVVWKPAPSATMVSWVLYQLLLEAGMPPEVVSFVPGLGADVGDVVLAHPELAAVHFTGSTGTFRKIWQTVGERIGTYRSYPRLVGETGGKDFVLAHPSADPEALVAALIRGAFEYQGQKCSAASRAYIPASLWDRIGERLIEETRTIRMGDPADFSNFMNAVIDQAAFDKIRGYLEIARSDSGSVEILTGGGADDSVGYFIEPTIVKSARPDHQLMTEEIFGPVLTLYVYPDLEFEAMIDRVDQTSPYALTGAIFARDRHALTEARQRLRFAAGNFYLNDKPTGAVVGQQPFGGSRASGTNDKAGSLLNLLRFTSPRSIKENLNPPTDYRYPFLEQ